ncbi:MAG: hypothetical protein RIT45_1097 [Pseudomonadota bacterium]|jgi:hypothetical protein
MRRELMAVLVGLTALLTAVAVGAQVGGGAGTGDDSSTEKVDLEKLRTQGAGLVTQINDMMKAAEKMTSDAKSGSAGDLTCMNESYTRMRSAARFALDSAKDLENAVRDNNESEATKAYGRVASYYEVVVSAYGAMQGCGGATGGAVIDGAPLQQNSNNMQTTTNPTGGSSGTDNLSDLQVGAEQSKLGSDKAIEGGN